MIKSFSINRILKMTVFIFILFLFYLFPNNNEYNLNTMVVNSSLHFHDIYLVDNNNYVSKTTIMVNSIENERMAEDLLNSLVIGSKNSIKVPEGFKQIIPKDTKIINLKIENKNITVTFSKEIKSIKDKDKMLECIVYTLTSIGNIKYVNLKVEKDDNFFKNKYDRSIGINKVFNLDSLNDIKSITVYYVSKYNDVNYYVPVTKYINSKNDKIKIIIEELSSKSSYESNLMSYLNYEAKLTNYVIDNDNIYLYFNNAILNSDKDNKILEEVVYSISYSIKDSIEVSNIHFFVNDKEI